MRFVGRPLAFALALCLCVAARAADLPDLGQDVITTTAALNTNQQRQLTSFVQAWTDRLISGEDDQVAEARAKLADMFQRGGSAIFIKQFAQALTPQLAKALTSERVIVRLNAMIVSTRQIDAGTVNLILTGLKDSSAAVRYWAAKAMVQLAGAGAANPAQALAVSDQQALLSAAALTAANKEESPQVVEQLIAAMAMFGAPDAIDRVITLLNDRVNLLGEQRDPSLTIDHHGLDVVYLKLVEQRAKGEAAKVKDETLQRLALVSYRFMILALVKLQAAQVKPEQQQPYNDMVQLGEAILGWVATQVGAQQFPDAGGWKEAFYQRNWAALLRRSDQWREVLKRKPFNFTDQDLEVVNNRSVN